MDSPQDSQLDFSFNFDPIPPIPKLDLNKMDSHIHQVHNQAAIHYVAQEDIQK